jgi:hypothetical protein
MSGVLAGFGAIWAVTAVGWIVGRYRLFGPQAELVLARLVFFVAAPALLFRTLALADPAAVFSPVLLAFVGSTLAVAAVYIGWSRFRKRSLGETTIGTLCASYVNAANLGLPIAAYVLGDPSYVAPVLLFQLLVAAPVSLAALDAAARGRPDLRNLALLPARNPIILASAAGLVVALAGWRLPDPVLRPFELVGSAAVPAALLALGMSLHGSRPLASAPDRADRFLAVGLKTLAQPVVAYLIARFALGLDGVELFAAVVLSALPTAQNVFVYALRYERGQALARDAIVLSTVVSAVVLAMIAVLLGQYG